MNEIERSKQILAGMSIEEKVGQLFVVRCPQEGAKDAVATYKLGGFTREFNADHTVKPLNGLQNR